MASTVVNILLFVTLLFAAFASSPVMAQEAYPPGLDVVKVGLNEYMVNGELVRTAPAAAPGEEYKAEPGPPLNIQKVGLNEYMVNEKRIKSNIPAPPGDYTGIPGGNS